jgi:hypothetical protein
VSSSEREKAQKIKDGEKEPVSVVITSGMNEAFRVCGVDQADDRRAEGPTDLKVFLAVRPPSPCQLTAAFHTQQPQTYVYEANLWAYMNYIWV